MDEFAIIARHFAPLAGQGSFGLGDDAAQLPTRPGHDLIVTTDTLTVGTDFFPGDPADTIARKALRVNLSDLAAKGAAPVCYLLSLTLPGTVTDEWLAAFAGGLANDQQTFRISLLGGDTGEGPLAITIAAFGFVRTGGMIRRDGAQVGDHVYVTGTIGDSGAGLAVLRGQGRDLPQADRDGLVARYLVPEPPVAFGAGSFGTMAHAGADVSDGLIADLGHIAHASKVAVVVDGARIPLAAPVRALWGERALVRAVTVGDDYQIVFTGPPGLSGPFTHIGHVESGAGVRLMLDGRLVSLTKAGFRHFQG